MKAQRVQEVTVFPVVDDHSHARAMARIDALWGAPKGSRAGAELEVLATLVAAYESKRWPIDRPDPLAMIEFRLEQLGLERSALTPLFGSASRVPSKRPKTKR